MAVLHDVCEDCPEWTFERLREEGFAEPLLAALEAVTKRPPGEETYMDFVQRAIANPIGRAVKKADLEDNSDLSRISEPTARDHERLARYARALKLFD